MANFDVNTFVIDRPLRGLMLSSDDRHVMWAVNEITNPTLNVTTDKVDAVNALGAKIMTFERAKNAEFSAENSTFDLGLYAAQAGTDKLVATSTLKITTPCFEDAVVAEGKITLKHTPNEQIPFIYIEKPDSTLGTRYQNGTAASETEFVHAKGTNEITVPEGIEDGTYFFVEYNYDTEEAVAVENKATEFPKAGIFLLEVLGSDICNQSKLYHAYVEFPNAKLVSDVDITFSTESTHNFTIQAMPNVCDREKKLLRIIVPNED